MKNPTTEKEKKNERVYYDKPNEKWDSYGCSYSDEFLKLDIDDYNHKTGTLDEAIHEKPKSEAILALLDTLGVKYNGIRTENGVHLFFRVPSNMRKKTIPPWYSV